MKINYAVYNPLTGCNEEVETKGEAMNLFWKIALDIALPYFHSTAYSIVHKNDDGTESWFNESYELMGIGEEVKKMLFEKYNFNNEIYQPTKVETLP